MSFFVQALNQGYNQSQILQFMIRNIPSLGNFVNKAMKEGHTEQQIMHYLGETIPRTFSSGKLTENEIRNLKGKLNTERSKRYASSAISLALPTAGAIVSGLNMLGQNTPQPGTQPGTGQQTITNPIPQPSLAPVPQPQQGPQLGLQPTPTQPPTQLQSPSSSPLSFQSIQKQAQQSFGNVNKIDDAVKKLISKSSNIGKIDATTDLASIQKMFSLSRDEALLTISDYNKKMGYDVEAKSITKQPENQVANISKEALKIPKPNSDFTFPKIDYKSLKKSDDVVTNDGLGTFEQFAGNGALVNINGKVKKIPLEDLKGTPEYIQQAQIALDLSKIPEHAKSGMLGFVYHTPDKKNLTINFNPSEDVYVYRRKDGKPFDQDFLDKVNTGTVLPITTGNTYFGSWNKNIADSRGAHISKDLIKQAQLESEEDDPNKPYYYVKLSQSYLHPYRKALNDVLKIADTNYKRSFKNEKETTRKRKST